jgi:hypothetical protein
LKRLLDDAMRIGSRPGTGMCVRARVAYGKVAVWG